MVKKKLLNFDVKLSITIFLIYAFQIVKINKKINKMVAVIFDSLLTNIITSDQVLILCAPPPIAKKRFGPSTCSFFSLHHCFFFNYVNWDKVGTRQNSTNNPFFGPLKINKFCNKGVEVIHRVVD